MTTQSSEREAYEKEAERFVVSCAFPRSWPVGDVAPRLADFLANHDAKRDASLRVPSESEAVKLEGWREAQRWLVEIYELDAARKMNMKLKEAALAPHSEDQTKEK